MVAVGVLAGALAAPASAQRTVYEGQYQCNDRGVVTPLAGMNVELWKRGDSFWPVEWVGRRVARGYTGSDGGFSMRAPEEEDNYFVRMALRDAYGVHLRDFWGINDWSEDLPERRNDVRTRNFGAHVFAKSGKSHKCAIWAGVHKAYEEFRSETGTELPSRGVEIEADSVGEVPFTPGTSMLWTPDYPAGHDDAPDDSTTRHEFAHAMRHGLDGDFGHFVGDAATFNYAQSHRPCDHQNFGYAFNEGWAEFWARRFGPAPDCGRPGDMETEGNVAAALTELMENCAGGQRKLMVKTLRDNPLRIHSFQEFRDALGCPIPKQVPVLVISSHTEEQPPPKPPDVRARVVHQEVSAATKQIRGLQKSLKAALRKAKRPPACKRPPCRAALKTLTRPAAIKFEIQLVRIQRGAVAPFDTKKEQSKYAALGFQKLLKGQAKRLAKERKKVVKVSLARIREAMKAARPVFQADSSQFAKIARRDLAKALARFRRAKRKGSKVLPGSMVLLPAGAKLPRRVPRIPVPPETPIPGPTLDERAISLLVFEECPPAFGNPKPIEVSGKLTPAAANSEVRVTFIHAGHEPVVQTVKTDASGGWAASYNPGASNTGTWNVKAEFAGDATRRASTADACQVEYLP